MSDQQDSPVIVFEHVSKRFTAKKRQVDALQDMNLSINRGDIFGIIGFSGAGKSTLMRMVNALETPSSGRVTVQGQDVSVLKGKDLRSLRKNIGMIFQQFNLLDSKSVYDNVATPLILNREGKVAIQRRVTELLEFVGLSDKANSFPPQLSGGQKQRVGIARALATSPDILLCDEATSSLDPDTTESILNLLERVNRELNVTILFVTHMIDVIRRLCNRVAVMEHGRVVEEGAVIDVFSGPKNEMTRRFVSTVIPDKIPDSLIEELKRDSNEYALIRFRFDSSNATDDVIWQINAKYPDIRTNVMFASVTELQGRILSVIILQVTGKKENIDLVIDYINAKGIAWEYVTL